MSARVDRATLTLWNPTGSEERPLSGKSGNVMAEPFVAETSTAAFFRVAWGRSASNSVHPPSVRRKLIPYGKFALERGTAGRGRQTSIQRARSHFLHDAWARRLDRHLMLERPAFRRAGASVSVISLGRRQNPTQKPGSA